MRFMKIMYTSLIFALLCSLCGCNPVYFTYSEDFTGFDLHQVAVYNVPGGEVPVSIVKMIAEDSYGRILFSYTVEDDFYPICAYVICQKRDEYVSYYEDACVLVAEDFSYISETEISNLKAKNDWDKPFCEERLTHKKALQQKDAARDYNTVEAFELENSTLYQNRVDEIFDAEISKIDEGECALVNYAGMDREGRVLYYIYHAPFQQTSSGEGKHYAIIINADGSYEESAYIAIDDFYNCSEDIRKLKRYAGWRS